MLRYVFRALAACASIAFFSLLALPVSAQFQVHPQQGGARIGTPEDPEDRFGTAVAIRSELAFISATVVGACNDINLGGISGCEFFSGAVFSYTGRATLFRLNVFE